MNRLNVAIVGLCGVAAGFLAGLVGAAIARGSMAEVVRQREELRQQSDDLRRRVDRLEVERAEFKGRAEKAEEKASKLSGLHAVTITNLMKSQALLAMSIRFPEIHELIRREGFDEKIKADWFFPNLAFDLIGGRWFLEELVERKILDRKVLKEFDGAAARGTSGIVTDSGGRKWTVSGSKTTESFAIRSKSWRVSWEFFRTDFEEPTIMIMVRRKDGDSVSAISGGRRDASIVHDRPGEFYLEVAAIGGDAEISVEELED